MCKLYFQLVMLVLAFVLMGQIGVLAMLALFIAQHKFASKKTRVIRKITVDGRTYTNVEIK